MIFILISKFNACSRLCLASFCEFMYVSYRKKEIASLRVVSSFLKPPSHISCGPDFVPLYDISTAQ